MIDQVTLNFEPDRDKEPDEELHEEQWYWNYNDGELFYLLENREDEVTIIQMDGSVDIYEKEGMIYQSECIGHEIRPVNFEDVDENWNDR
jgi:hypothetical protein